jgi:prepilin-type N-terminal cleavage/methylation domain-containing protein
LIHFEKMRTPAQIIRDHRNGKKGFTLVEVIIATSIFSVVSLIGVGIFVNVIRIQRRIYLEDAIYEDGRFMMERLAREIRQNTVDYEEYYNSLVENKTYGAGQGCYATRFYNPGTGGPEGDSELGAYCNTPPQTPQLNPGCVVDKNTLDVNTGQNPYTSSSGYDASSANAMCDQHFASGTNCGTDFTLYDQPQLYLVDGAGKQKTIFALKEFNADEEKSLSMIRLEGEDADKDDIVEKWYDDIADPIEFYCSALYDCNLPETITDLKQTLGIVTGVGLYQGFVPISPMRTNITSLHFYIAPLDDPRKAFAENDLTQAIQQQPHVTVVMTLQPAAAELSGFTETPPTITLQNTITSRVFNEVKSYYPADICENYIGD